MSDRDDQPAVPTRFDEDPTWPGVAAAYAAWPGGRPPRTHPTTPGIIPPPREPLDPRARTIWFINNLIAVIVIVAIVAAVVVMLHMLVHLALVWTIPIPVAVAVVLLAIAWLGPRVRYHYWRFEIREDEVDLQHGFITRARQIVPMSRIQLVDTRQGPLDRRYRVANVIFYTAAGSLHIPALSVERAAEVRSQIAALAKVHDDL